MRVDFDRFTFDSQRRELLDAGHPVHLGPKAFRALEVLIEERPRAIGKQELIDRIWDDTVVDESNLAGLINELRTALADRARKSRFIRTVHGFGYAFCAAAPAESTAFVVFQRKPIQLHEGANVLGRDASADIQIDHETVSRKHAVITIDGSSATIEDLASKNGTFIDSVKLEGTTPLREGQSFVLGDASITFRTKPSTGSTVSVSRLRKRR